MHMKRILVKFLPKQRISINGHHKKRVQTSRFNPLQAVEKTLDEFDRKPDLAPL